jgi:hypothetical protein
MKQILSIVAAILIVFVQQKLIAQEKWSVEFRPGIDVATKKIADADIGTGFGFEGTIAYRFMPHLAAYTGWSWNNFSAEKYFAGEDGSFEETGYTFGLQFIHPIGKSKINYLLRIGGTYNHLEIENNDGDIIIDSGHGLGWQTEAGIVIPISDKLSLSPSIRYRSLSRDIEIANANKSIQLNYLSAGIGLSWSF